MKLAHSPAARPVTPALPPTRGRGAWAPAPAGPYRLPRAVEIRLVAALEGFRNRDAALELAVYLGRIWTIPRLLGLPFPVDRRAMAERSTVDLTEARIRGALRVLEDVGFLERDPLERGSRYRATETGLHRKPVLWRFGSEFLPAFAAANAKAKARQAQTPATAAPALRRQDPPQVAQRDTPTRIVLMGEIPRPAAADPDSPLEAALGRLLVGLSGGVKRGSGR